MSLQTLLDLAPPSRLRLLFSPLLSSPSSLSKHNSLCRPLLNTRKCRSSNPPVQPSEHRLPLGNQEHPHTSRSDSFSQVRKVCYYYIPSLRAHSLPSCDHPLAYPQKKCRPVVWASPRTRERRHSKLGSRTTSTIRKTREFYYVFGFAIFGGVWHVLQSHHCHDLCCPRPVSESCTGPFFVQPPNLLLTSPKITRISRLGQTLIAAWSGRSEISYRCFCTARCRGGPLR